MHRKNRPRFLWFKNLPRFLQGLLVGVFCACLMAGLGWGHLMDIVERDLIDVLFRVRGPLPDPAPQVVIVLVDDPTVSEANRWPLPRRYYADIIRKLKSAHARTVAFDLLFSTPGYTPEDDETFIRACRSFGEIVPAAMFHVNDKGASAITANLHSDTQILKLNYAVTDRGASALTAAWGTSALPDIGSVSPAVGHINVYPELDGKLRKIPHLVSYRGNLYPSLALASAAVFLGKRPRDIIAEEKAVRVAGRIIPIDRNGEAWVNWVGGPNAFPTFYFQEVLRDEFDSSVFHDKLVLVGSIASGAYEYRATPYAPLQPAIELQASAIDNILQNRPLREVAPLYRWAITLLFPMLCGALIAPRSALAGTVFILALLLAFFLGLLIAFAHSFYMPAAAPLLGALLTYAATTAMNYRQEWEANWRADASVATLARGGALMTSGRDRHKLLAVIRRTAREALQAQEVYIVLERHNDDFLLNEVATRVIANEKSLTWSGRKGLRLWTRLRSAADLTTTALPEPLLKQLTERAGKGKLSLRREVSKSGQAVVAAPLFYRMTTGSESAGELPGAARHAHGAVIAVGRRMGGTFSQRDVTLLETIAEQAGLALENLAFYERLQGRIELANRDLRDAYQLLEEQSAKLTAAVESIDDALIVTDPVGHAIFINAASSRILGDAAPHLGDNVPAVLGEAGFAALAALFEQLHYAPETTAGVGHELLHQDTQGTRRILSSNLTPLVGSDGTPLGAMLVVADVTAQRELEQMKTDFVSYVAHELRTPLTTILGYASLLHDSGDQFPLEQRTQMTVSIMNHCQRLNRMITEMLDIARLDAGRPLTLHIGPFDLVHLCETVVSAQTAALRNADIFTLTLHTEVQPMMIQGDRDRIEQVLTNLEANAVKYSPEGGRVDVELRDADGYAEIIVRDTGMGMTPEQMTQLFQKFYRTPDAQARGIKGTGLGLFLVKQLVEAHQGTIEVESSAGQGSTFTVRLPKIHPETDATLLLQPEPLQPSPEPTATH